MTRKPTLTIEAPHKMTARHMALIYVVRPASKVTARLFALLGLLMTTAAWCNPGDLLWESVGQSESFGYAYAIGAEGNVVVATGDVCTGLSLATCDWLVRAHDARSGAKLWEDRVGSAIGYDGTEAVAVHAGRAFVAGWVRNAARGRDFVVRAYSLKVGTLLWERRVDHGRRFDEAFSIVAGEGQVFVAGNLYSETATPNEKSALLALDSRTGVTLWQSVSDGAFGSSAKAVRTDGKRVFVAVLSGSTAQSGTSLLVQARNVQTGALLWENEIPDALPTLTHFNVGSLAVGGGLVFVGGMARKLASVNIGGDFIVLAYDARTGAMVWTDQVHRQDGGMAASLSFGAGRVFAWGWDCDATVFNCHGAIRAYDPQSGTLQWEARFTGPGADVLTPLPTAAFQVHGGRVFVGDGLLNIEGRYEWTVRSYDAIGGTLQWENRIDNEGFLNQPFGLKAVGGRLFVAGQTETANGNYQFTVRAYYAGHDDAED